MNLTLVAPQLVLVVGAAVTLVAALVLPQARQWVGAPLALATLAAGGLVQAGLLARSDQLAFDGMWVLDAATGVAGIVICGAAALAVLLAPEWLATDPRHGEYYALVVLAALGAMVMAAAGDLNQLIVGVVLSSVTGYVLAAYHRRSALAVEAGMSYFLIGGLANLALLVAAVLAFAATGTTLYADMALTPGLTADADPWLLVPLAATGTVALAFKAGAVPAHGWVPDVAQGAPVPSAALLTVVPKIGGMLALARLVSLLPAESGVGPAVAVVAALTMTLGNLAALRQDDVRRLLGWSSVSQAGYALMGVAAVGRSDEAVGALLLFLAVYAVANVGAFAVVALLRGRTRIEDYAGLARTRPWAAAALTLCLLSLVGIPPLAGFAGKLAVFTATIDAGLGWLAVLAVVNTVVSLAYYLRVIAPAYLGTPGQAPVHLLGRWAGVATGLTAAGVVGLGLIATLVLSALEGQPLLP